MRATTSLVTFGVLVAACAGAQPASPPRDPAPQPAPSAAIEAAPLDAGAASTTASAVDASVAAPVAHACAPMADSFTAQVSFSTGVVKSPVPHVVGEGPGFIALHEKLARIARGSTEKVRIAFYGDSNMTRDFISGAFRRAMQARFGDAGHGFVAAARPWGWYEHMDIRHDVTPKEDTPWGIFSVSGRPLTDKVYGFANIAAETSRGGATTWVATAYGAGASPVGKTASAAEIFYLKRPQGGAFHVQVDGATVQDVSTEADTVQPASVRVTFPDGPHKVEAVVKGGRAVRIFGTSLERENAGVIVDSLGAGALNFELLAHVDSATRVAQLRDRKYDMVVFLLGTNLLGAASQRKWVSAVLEDFRTALPDTALMLMSPPDQGISHTNSASNPAVAKLAKDLRETALAEHVLFWDFYEGMGGNGAIRNFVRTGLGEPDCVHLGFSGATLMGTRFASEIVRGFKSYVDENPNAGCQKVSMVSSPSTPTAFVTGLEASATE